MKLLENLTGRYLVEAVSGKIINVQKVASDEIVTSLQNLPALIADPAITHGNLLTTIQAVAKARA